jgi:hypothetical protein
VRSVPVASAFLQPRCLLLLALASTTGIAVRDFDEEQPRLHRGPNDHALLVSGLIRIAGNVGTRARSSRTSRSRRRRDNRTSYARSARGCTDGSESRNRRRRPRLEISVDALQMYAFAHLARGANRGTAVCEAARVRQPEAALLGQVMDSRWRPRVHVIDVARFVAPDNAVRAGSTRSLRAAIATDDEDDLSTRDRVVGAL